MLFVILSLLAQWLPTGRTAQNVHRKTTDMRIYVRIDIGLTNVKVGVMTIW